MGERASPKRAFCFFLVSRYLYLFSNVFFRSASGVYNGVETNPDQIRSGQTLSRDFEGSYRLGLALGGF